MLTTLQQANKLKELGFGLTFTAFRYEKSTGDVYNSYDPLIQCQSGDLFIKAPTISEALEWFREVKGIMCGIDIVAVSKTYQGKFIRSGATLPRYVEERYSTHAEAESALLDAIIKYVEK